MLLSQYNEHAHGGEILISIKGLGLAIGSAGIVAVLSCQREGGASASNASGGQTAAVANAGYNPAITVYKNPT